MLRNFLPLLAASELIDVVGVKWYYMYVRGTPTKGIAVNRTWMFILLLTLLAFVLIPSAIAEKGGDSTTCEPTQWLVVANGHSEADTAVAGAVAADDEATLVFVAKDRVPEATRVYLEGRFGNGDPLPTYIIGGEKVVTPDVIRRLQEIAPGTANNIIRLGGEDRFETATAAANTNAPCRVVSSDEEGTVGK